MSLHRDLCAISSLRNSGYAFLPKSHRSFPDAFYQENIMSFCPTTGDVNYDHSVKVVYQFATAKLSVLNNRNWLSQSSES